MDGYDEIEIESEAYTSVWLIQNLIKRCKDIKVLKSDQIPEIEYVLQNPHIILIRNKQSGDILDDSICLMRAKFKGTVVPVSKKETLGANMRRPFAIVFMLRIEGRHGECSLNQQDAVLLDNAKRLIPEMEDVVYILKYNAGHKETYDETDLHMVSEEIQKRISEKNSRNKIFPKLFFMHDEQIHIRIGLCLHRSILCHLKQIFRKIEKVLRKCETDLTTLSQIQAFGIKVMTKSNFQSSTKVCRYSLLEIRENVNIILSDVISKCQLQFADVSILDPDNIPDIFFGQCRYIDTYLISVTSSRPRYITRSKARQFKYNVSSATGKRKTKEIGNKTGYSYVWNRTVTSIVKKVFITSFKVVMKSITKVKDQLSALCQNIQEEYTKRGDNVTLHEWKIVSERNHQIKGFGCIRNKIVINISRDDESCKDAVLKYLEKYLDVHVTQYTVSIECKKRKFTPFSSLEQGSRINRANAERYGTLGMFFQDNTDTYFFTTCAHVIGENTFAYSHTDNTRIGRSVFVVDSGTGMEDSQETHMDFSLIEVSPERNLTCTFGLKTLSGKFIEGHIFHGDLLDILHRTLYKWGATKPYFRKGKCVGYVRDGAVLILEIDTPDFAGPGDSGAIICIDDDPKLGLAAFVLVGGDIDNETGVATYAVYKVSEAIAKVSELQREIKPCLIPFWKSINISE